MSQFRLSERSKARLSGVHPDLIRVVMRAIEITKIDFGVTEGLRTEKRQRELVAAGASKTMNSRHITGHAVDLAAFVGRELRWDFGLYIQLAEAMRDAAREFGIPVVWGGSWMLLNNMDDVAGSVAQYTARKKQEGDRPLIDGPHFELWREVYT